MSSRRDLLRSVRDSLERGDVTWAELRRQALGRGFWRKVRYALSPPKHAGWTDHDGSVRVRTYRSYDEYVEHQASKRELLDLEDWDRRLHAALTARYRPRADELAGRSILCLGARQGSEVRAFTELGAFAVGIDLNPGDSNAYVLPGDFHQLQFASASVDFVYTNSLDHVLDLDRLLGEVHRVLKPSGMLLLEAMLGRDEGVGDFDFWATLEWDSIEDLVRSVETAGYALATREPFDEPWAGQALWFHKQGADR